MTEQKTYWVIKTDNENYKGEQLYLSRAIRSMCDEQDFEETTDPLRVIKKYSSKQSCKRAINTWYKRKFLDAKDHWKPVKITQALEKEEK